MLNIKNASSIFAIAFALIFSSNQAFAEHRFCLQMGNGGGTGFLDSGPDLSFLYGYEGKFFHIGGGIQYNAGNFNMTEHFFFDLTTQKRVLQWTLLTGPLYHIGIPEKEIVIQDTFLCIAPKLVIIPSHTEIQLFGGVGGSAMTLRGIMKKAITLWDFNMIFGVTVSQKVGIVFISGSLATCSYFRYDFPLVPRISAEIDILCTEQFTFGYAAIFQFSEFAKDAHNTFFTDFYFQAVLKYVF